MELFFKKLILGSQLLSKCNIFLKPCKICSITSLQETLQQKGHHKTISHQIPQFETRRNVCFCRKPVCSMVLSYQTMRIIHTIFSFFLDCQKAVKNLEYNKFSFSIHYAAFSSLTIFFVYGPYMLSKILSECRWYIYIISIRR